jgi:hypothetical protein
VSKGSHILAVGFLIGVMFGPRADAQFNQLNWSCVNLIDNIPDITTNSAGWLVQMYRDVNNDTDLSLVTFWPNGTPTGAGSSADDVLLVSYTTSLFDGTLFDDEEVYFSETFTFFSELTNRHVYTVILDAEAWSNAVPGIHRTFVLDASAKFIGSGPLQSYIVPADNPGNHSWQLIAGGTAQGTESFASGFASWQPGGAAWVWTNSYPTVTFASAGTGTFSAVATSSGGAFVGDYTAAEVELVGFELYVGSVLPNGVAIQLFNDSQSILGHLTDRVTRTQSWHYLALPVTPGSGAFWTGHNGGSLATVLTNVTELRIILESPGVEPHSHQISNVFLGQLPWASNLTATGGVAQVEWQELRPNWTYQLQATTNLLNSADWLPIATQQVFGTSHSFTDDNVSDNPLRIYRLNMD